MRRKSWRRKIVLVAASCFAIVVLFCVRHSFAQVGAEPQTALLSARAVAANARSGKVYAVLARENAVAVFSARNEEPLKVAVGNGPVALAINESTNRIYVANNGAGTISVIDGNADSVVARLQVGARPYAIAVNEGLNRIFLSNTFSDVITVIDGETHAMKKVKAGSANVIVSDAKSGRTYLLGYENPDITVLSPEGEIAGKIRVGIHLWGMVLDEAKNRLLVTRAGDAHLAEVDLAPGKVTLAETGKIPCNLAMDVKTGEVWVVNHGDNSVSVFQAAKRGATATVAVGEGPQGIAIDADRGRAYVANTNGKSVSVIDTKSLRVVKTLRTTGHPHAIALTSGKIVVATVEGGAEAIAAPR